MKELFLIAALALPPANMWSCNTFKQEYKMLLTFLHTYHPTSDFMITSAKRRHPKRGLLLPIQFRGQLIYEFPRRSA